MSQAYLIDRIAARASTASLRSHVRRCGPSLLVFLLSLLALAWLWVCIAVLLRTESADYGEAIVYEHAARFASGPPIYRPLDDPPYSVAAYTPAYYVLAGALQKLITPGFFPGRMISLLSAILACIILGRIFYTMFPDGVLAFAASLSFLALGLPAPGWSHSWGALYRVDLLGLVFALSSILVLAKKPTGARVVVAAIAASMAVLTKQTYLTVSVAITAWLLLQHRHFVAPFILTNLLLVGAPCLLMELQTGALFQNTIFANVNPMAEFGSVWGQLKFMLRYQGVPILLSSAYFLLSLKQGIRAFNDVMLVYWMVSFVPVLGLLKVGAIHNYWIDLAAASAVLSTLCLAKTLSESGGTSRVVLCRVFLTLMIAQCVLAVRDVRHQIVREYHELTRSSANGDQYTSLLGLTRASSGYVVTDELDLLVLSDKSVLYEPVIFSILHSQGLWDPSRLTAAICDGDVSLLILRSPLEQYQHTGAGGVPLFPDPILHALVRCMRPLTTFEGRHIYAPEQPARSL